MPLAIGIFKILATQANNATKHDSGKPRLDLLPVEPLLQNSRGFRFWRTKYGDYNFGAAKKMAGLCVGGFAPTRLGSYLPFWNNEDCDTETCLPHLDQAACNIMFLLEFMNNGGDVDDRVRKEGV